MISLRPLTTLLLLSLLAGSNVYATESRYRSWNKEDKVQNIVDQLRKLVTKAERERAADRRFLRDLRALISTYDKPWRQEVLHDNFHDGDFSHDPRWLVSSGSFFVDRKSGLRSIVEKPPAARAPAQKTGQSGNSGDIGADLAAAIFGAILESPTQKPKPTTTPQPESPQGNPATIETSVNLSNAFALQLELRSGQTGEGLELGIENKGGGYWLVYRPGNPGRYELLRTTSRGMAMVEQIDHGPTLEDGARHQLNWTRDGAGFMRISVDNALLMEVADRSFRKSFDRLVVRNLGGDFAIQELSLMGVEKKRR